MYLLQITAFKPKPWSNELDAVSCVRWRKLVLILIENSQKTSRP